MPRIKKAETHVACGRSERTEKRRLTEWHLWEKVVDDMVAGHVVEEEPAHPAQEVAVDRRSGAPLEIPLRLAIVRQLRVRVVQVRDHDEPVRVSGRERRATWGMRQNSRSGGAMQCVQDKRRSKCTRMRHQAERRK